MIIIGSNPTEKIKELSSSDVVVTGYVSEATLEDYYQNARVCIIPLRYGAGVKGKTIEAMYHQIPIVSTGIGIEGLEGIEKYIRAFDEPDLFGEELVNLYTNITAAEKSAERYCEYLKEHFSYDAAHSLFERVFSGGRTQ